VKSSRWPPARRLPRAARVNRRLLGSQISKPHFELIGCIKSGKEADARPPRGLRGQLGDNVCVGRRLLRFASGVSLRRTGLGGHRLGQPGMSRAKPNPILPGDAFRFRDQSIVIFRKYEWEPNEARTAEPPWPWPWRPQGSEPFVAEFRIKRTRYQDQGHRAAHSREIYGARSRCHRLG